MATDTRERKILDASADLFYKKGYDAVGVDEIGESAGISGPAVYRHFSSKEEILTALFDEAIDGLLQATGGRFANPKDELQARVRLHAEFVISQIKLASVWIREDRSLSEEHRRRLRRREAGYVDGWKKCVKEAYPHLNQAAADLAAQVALGSLNATVLWPAGTIDGRPGIDSVVTFVLGGLEASAAPR